MTDEQRYGIALDGDVPMAFEIDLAQRAEQVGAHSIWTQENFYLRDGISTAAGILVETSDILVAAGTLSPYARHPIVYGITAARLQDAGNGRAALLLGSGTPESLERMGIAHRSPLGHLRETIEILRTFFSGERVEHAGEFYEIEKIRLTSGALDPPPPIYLAAMGPKMLELAGELADGVLLPVGSAPYAAWAQERIAEGARRASRDLSDVLVAANVVVASEKEARSDDIPWFRARHLMGFHFASDYYQPIVTATEDATGLKIDQGAIRKAFMERDWAKLEALVPLEVLRHFVVFGSESEWHDAFDKYRAAGVDVPVLFLVEDAESRRNTAENALEFIRASRRS